MDRRDRLRARAGAIFGLIHVVFAVNLNADQIVSGTAINLLAVGITGYLFVDIYGTNGTPDDLPGVPDVHLPIKSVPLLGDVFGQLNLLVWVALALVVITWVVVFRTAPGLRLRAAGENPLAAETAGLSVVRTRYAAVMTSGALAALGGAFLSIGFVHSFSPNMTAGRGFIALAALIFGRWRPGYAFAGALLFGFGSALAQRLPTFSQSGAVLFQALPYVLTLIAVTGLVGRSIATGRAWAPTREALVSIRDERCHHRGMRSAAPIALLALVCSRRVRLEQAAAHDAAHAGRQDRRQRPGVPAREPDAGRDADADADAEARGRAGDGAGEADHP